MKKAAASVAGLLGAVEVRATTEEVVTAEKAVDGHARHSLHNQSPNHTRSQVS